MEVSTKPQDKRIRRTRQALAQALIALTLEKSYEAVTIQEITDRAGVGYRTYFRHYADKDALLHAVLRTTVADLRLMIEPTAPGAGVEPGADYHPLPAENGRLIFEHIAAHADLYHLLLSSGSAALEPVMAYARLEALDSLQRLAQPPLPPPILAEHLVVTTFALVRWWLENEMPYTPQEMADYLARLVTVPGA